MSSLPPPSSALPDLNSSLAIVSRIEVGWHPCDRRELNVKTALAAISFWHAVAVLLALIQVQELKVLPLRVLLIFLGEHAALSLYAFVMRVFFVNNKKAVQTYRIFAFVVLLILPISCFGFSSSTSAAAADPSPRGPRRYRLSQYAFEPYTDAALDDDIEFLRLDSEAEEETSFSFSFS